MKSKFFLISLLFLFCNHNAILANEFQGDLYRPLLKTEQERVYYNTSSHIFHKFSCIWAQRCTKNCIVISKLEALSKGRACKVCGG
jgi:hypothetical protein